MLYPGSIAVIGASATPGKVGHAILKNLRTQGFKGKVFAVNPKGGEILGEESFKSIADLPSVPDLAVVATPAATVPGILQECSKRGVNDIIVISAGFSETHTEEGATLEKEIQKIANTKNLNVLGPNCLGMLRPSLHMNASFAKELPQAGGVALVSQSGALAVAAMDSASSYGIGFSAVLSIGNKAVMNESDILEMLESDAETRVIGLYLESIIDGRTFLEVAARVSLTKPIVLLKAGTSESGKRAAASHTGALAGTDAGIRAACAGAGIHRAADMEEFFDLLTVLGSEPPLQTEKIAIITNAGGPGILATDAAENLGLQLPALQKRTQETLTAALPAAASFGNPIDVLGDADAARFRAAIEAAGDDKNIDGLCVLLTPQVMTPSEAIATSLLEWQKSHSLMPVVTSFMGGDAVRHARAILREGGIPCTETPERALRMLAALKKSTDAPKKQAKPLTTKNSPLKGHAKGLMTEEETATLFAAFGLPMPAQAIATSAAEAAGIAKRIGFPVIAKVSSPDILHKTDVGGVRANLRDADAVEKAYEEIIENISKNAPKADVRGVLIQQFLPIGEEFIAGVIRDPSFGPLVMAGLGGIYAELFADTTFRMAPLTEKDAYAMLTELHSWKLLLGMRGRPQADIDALVHLLVTLGNLATACPEIRELDVNPVLVSSKGIVIADAKVIVG